MATQDFHILITQVASLQDLGARIKRARKLSKMRIDDAAALCGVSVGTLSRLESGKAAVTLDKVLRVMDRLGLTMVVTKKEDVRHLRELADDGAS